MLAARHKPIIVTGPHRSGSTWVGRMIASHPRVRYFSEPFNPDHPACPVRHYFHHMTEEDEPRFVAYLRQALELKYPWRPREERGRGAWAFASELVRALRCFVDHCRDVRPLLKDPMAFFSAEWLARRYAPDMIVLSRHPAAFASSLKRLNWCFPFSDLLNQAQLMEDYLGPFHAQIEHFSRMPPDIIAQAILLWRIVHHAMLRYRLKHPDWIFVRHEDLSARPEEGFRGLLEAIGLDFAARVRRTIALHSHSANPAEADAGAVHQLKRDSKGNIWNWTRRLRPEEILRIRRGTEDISPHFYAGADWRPPLACHTSAA